MKKTKKGLQKQAFYSVAWPSSTGAVRKRLKRTHYFQVGNRCLCPKVLSGRLFRSIKAWFPWVRVSVLSNTCFLYEHRRG